VVFLVATILLFLDVIFNLNLGYYHQGQFVSERWQIFARYARFDLYVDLYYVVFVPLTYF